MVVVTLESRHDVTLAPTLSVLYQARGNVASQATAKEPQQVVHEHEYCNALAGFLAH